MRKLDQLYNKIIKENYNDYDYDYDYEDKYNHAEEYIEDNEDIDDDDQENDYDKEFRIQCYQYEKGYSELFLNMLMKYGISFLKEIIKNIKHNEKPALENIISPCEFIDAFLKVISYYPEKWPEFKKQIEDVINKQPDKYESWVSSRTDTTALAFITYCMCQEKYVQDLYDLLKELNLEIKNLKKY